MGRTQTPETLEMSIKGMYSRLPTIHALFASHFVKVTLYSMSKSQFLHGLIDTPRLSKKQCEINIQTIYISVKSYVTLNTHRDDQINIIAPKSVLMSMKVSVFNTNTKKTFKL